MCSRQTSAKYTARDSPPFPANQCCGQMRIGNNGEIWVSTRSGAQNACTWKNGARKSPKKSPKRSPARKSKKSPKRVMSMATCIAEILRDEEITTYAQRKSWKDYAKKLCKQEIQDLKKGR